MKSLSRWITTLTALAALGLSSGCAQAQLVDVQVRDLETYATLPQYHHRGRQYIEGQPGHRYAVVMQNQTGERVLAVLSVDGVNAITGQTASAQQSGYVLEPWQRLEIRGWRKSMSDVAEFHFTDLPDSYAARTGRPDNVGVIGVAAYRERRPLAWNDHYQPPYRYREDSYPRSSAPQPRDDGGYAERQRSGSADARAQSAPAAPSLGAAEADSAATQELGTGHGNRRYDPAQYTQFERASSRPAQVVSLFYDSYEALAARGVLPRRWDRHYRGEPDPFPVGFVPDPY